MPQRYGSNPLPSCLCVSEGKEYLKHRAYFHTQTKFLYVHTCQHHFNKHIVLACCISKKFDKSSSSTHSNHFSPVVMLLCKHTLSHKLHNWLALITYALVQISSQYLCTCEYLSVHFACLCISLLILLSFRLLVHFIPVTFGFSY